MRASKTISRFGGSFLSKDHALLTKSYYIIAYYTAFSCLFFSSLIDSYEQTGGDITRWTGPKKFTDNDSLCRNKKKNSWTIYRTRGIFTVPQLKHLKRNMRINSAIPVGSLSEHQWGIIFKAMVKHVPRFRWPKIRKGMFIRF